MIEDYELYLFDTGKRIAREVQEKTRNEQPRTTPTTPSQKPSTRPVTEPGKKEGTFFERLFGKKKAEQPQPSSPDEKGLKPRDVYKTGGLLYTIARYNDTFDRIAQDLGFTARELARFNESPEHFSLRRLPGEKEETGRYAPSLSSGADRRIYAQHFSVLRHTGQYALCPEREKPKLCAPRGRDT